MSSPVREKVVIFLFDFLFALFAFWFARYFGDMPGWYWLVLSATIWVIFGAVTGKLRFGCYKRIRYALSGILALDIFSGVVLYFLYHHFVPGYEYDYSIVLAVGIIILLECVLYMVVRKLVYTKIPYFYEEPSLDHVVEKGINNETRSAQMVNNKDIALLLGTTAEHESSREVIRWVKENKGKLSENTVLLDSSDIECVLAHKTKNPGLIVQLFPLNGIRHLNTFLSFSNYCLENGGLAAFHCTTSGIRRERLMKQNPRGVGHVLHFFDYCWHRIIPKLPFTRNFYYWVTKGKARALTRVEVLGRIYRAGFDIVNEEVSHGEFYVIASKIKEPVRDDKPSVGLLIRLRRIGKDGKTIGVYKFRTMYAYSEYIQSYVLKYSELINGDKIADDYRVNLIGRYLRKLWIDELPQLINWMKGDIKLVGVRPLSQHKFSLYTKELQELRIKTKPGLIPPFYADMPGTLEEIQESEMRYLNSWLQSHFLTDWRYLCKALVNIILKGKRSK